MNHKVIFSPTNALSNGSTFNTDVAKAMEVFLAFAIGVNINRQPFFSRFYLNAIHRGVQISELNISLIVINIKVTLHDILSIKTSRISVQCCELILSNRTVNKLSRTVNKYLKCCYATNTSCKYSYSEISVIWTSIV